MIKQALCILPLLGIASCVTMSPAAKTIHDAEPKTVEHCMFLADLSTHGPTFANDQITMARKKLRNQAADIGATHLVWKAFQQGWNGSTVWAKAYRCGENTARF